MTTDRQLRAGFAGERNPPPDPQDPLDTPPRATRQYQTMTCSFDPAEMRRARELVKADPLRYASISHLMRIALHEHLERYAPDSPEEGGEPPMAQ